MDWRYAFAAGLRYALRMDQVPQSLLERVHSEFKQKPVGTIGTAVQILAVVVTAVIAVGLATKSYWIVMLISIYPVIMATCVFRGMAHLRAANRRIAAAELLPADSSTQALTVLHEVSDAHRLYDRSLGWLRFGLVIFLLLISIPVAVVLLPTAMQLPLSSASSALLPESVSWTWRAIAASLYISGVIGAFVVFPFYCHAQTRSANAVRLRFWAANGYVMAEILEAAKQGAAMAEVLNNTTSTVKTLTEAVGVNAQCIAVTTQLLTDRNRERPDGSSSTSSVEQ